MNDTFLSSFSLHLRQTQDARIAEERVTPLRPDMEARDRARMALQVIDDAIVVLEMVSDDIMLNTDEVDAIERAESRLAILRPRVKMRRGMLELTGMFGRAP